jgi:2-oxoglutarate ferredoxin oxidoreductase subunit beta
METTESTTIQYTAKDFKSDQYVRWCPGCGDYAVLSSLQKVMADLSISPQDTVVI